MTSEVEQYILTPKEPVTVRRNEDNQLTIHWDSDASRFKVYAGSSPESINYTTPIANGHQANSLALPNMDLAARHYFSVEFESGQTHLVELSHVLVPCALYRQVPSDKTHRRCAYVPFDGAL